MLKQNTLGGSFSLNGKGLHTGLNLTVTFNPAPEGHGYKIQRIDLEGQPIIDAVAEQVGDTKRGTVLVKGNVKVSTVEHALAALYAAGIDNCLIQVDGPEFPILDGSSKAYVEHIRRVGVKEQDAVKDFYVIQSKIECRDEATGSSILVFPDEKFSVSVLVSYDSKILYNQFATLENMTDFPTEIASARTFVFVREIEHLLAAGLIKGGDLDNAIVIYEREMSQENYDKLADVMRVPHMDATKLGYINHFPLAWDNEPARHKLLDIIGDLALIGKPIKGRIIATCPGHTINNKFTRQIRRDMKLHETQVPTNHCNEPLSHGHPSSLESKKNNKISPLAYIHPEAQIGENVEIGPFAFIDKNVVIGNDNIIMPNANILYGTRIGNGNTIFPGAVIGAIPQDLKFKGEDTTAEVGDYNTIRENVTINRGTAAKGRTIVGNNNLLMEGVHVAHDALIGNNCVIGNATKMAGEIIIDDNAILSGGVLMHQFCRVGGYVMVQGGSRFSKDIPPYIIAGREPIAYSGINLIGLRRYGFSNEQIENIHNAYRIIYQSNRNVSDALKAVRDEVPASPEIDYILSFIENSQRGIIR